MKNLQGDGHRSGERGCGSKLQLRRLRAMPGGGGNAGGYAGAAKPIAV